MVRKKGIHMCDSLDSRLSGRAKMHRRNPTRRKKKVLLWRRCLNSNTAVDVREEQQVTAAEDGEAEDKLSVRSLQKTA